MTVPRFEPIITDRFVLRPMHSDDVDIIWVRRNDPVTAKYQDAVLPYPRVKAQELVDDMVALDGIPPANGWFQLSVDSPDWSGPIGDLALRLAFDARCAEIGWTIEPARRGGGLATDASHRLAAWLFDSVGVSRVEAKLHPDNLASARVAEHLGMVFEGHTRNSFWVGDENSDDWIYGVTLDDWRAWNDRPLHAPDDVRLVDVTEHNIEAVRRLATHRTQERFVAPMLGSLGDALVSETHEGDLMVPWYRAVLADGVVAGFVMLAEASELHPYPHLWRLLIDRMHQHRGIGGRVVDLVLERARSMQLPGLDLGWVEGFGSPGPFYRGRGFVPTGVIEDGEILARLTF